MAPGITAGAKGGGVLASAQVAREGGATDLEEELEPNLGDEGTVE